MWKPGQIVTINRKKYRVKSITNEQREYGYSPCNRCAFYLLSADICKSLCFSYNKESKLCDYQYLEEIPAKGEVLAK